MLLTLVEADVTLSVKDNHDGSYTITYPPNYVGSYEIAIKSGTDHVAASPYTVHVTPGAIDARHCKATGGGLEGARVGTESSFLLLAYDKFGNRLIKPLSNDNISVTANWIQHSVADAAKLNFKVSCEQTPWAILSDTRLE